ncbi:MULTISPECIES: hypothetical protein [Vibrio]|nr:MULTISPECIES: hypothetical protein [Vibrio]MCQ8869762.1 hypothetical protein [Vibrio splendidus]MDH5925424.1 hypothetical protein [Vibrio lentus]
MPLLIPVFAGAAGLWGGFVISDGTKRLSWLIVLGLVVFGLFKMGVI